MSNYATIYEEYKHKFYQLPKVFFTNENYTGLSNNAKIAWAVLRDRASLSRKNNWYDKDTGRIYFIYTVEDLMEMLNLNSRTTISNIKKELESATLIEQKRSGFNRPNKIYLIYPIVDDQDIYKIDELEGFEAEPINTKKDPESQAGQGRPEYGRPKSERPVVQNMDPINTDLSNTNLKELDTLDTKTDFSTTKINNLNAKEIEKERERYLVDSFFNNDIVPPNIAKCLKTFSNSIEEAENFSRIIFSAKEAVELSHGFSIELENDEETEKILIDTFTRSLRITKTKGKRNPDGYIYRSIITTLNNHLDRRKKFEVESAGSEKKVDGKVVYYNWLEERD